MLVNHVKRNFINIKGVISEKLTYNSYTQVV